MCKKLLFCLVGMFLLLSNTISAQTKVVSGTITDESNIPLIGVSIVLKGTLKGVESDFDGKYSITIPEDGILIISMLGFASQEFDTKGITNLNVTLLEDTTALDEVVVTAFGKESRTRTLGYAVAEVKGEDMVESRAVNLGNALSGKVAGVVVSNPATGAGGTSRVTIRGGSSLTGQDQPLYVVNGVPIENSNQGAAGTWGGSDGGDGLSTLNPDDIKDISVLKGNAAAALYGARAANGVILITTKSGKARRGIGVSYNSNMLFDVAIDHTDFQKEYGHGTLGAKPANTTEALDFGNRSWGAKLDGSQVVQFDGVERPYSDTGEGINDFFRTGYTITNTLGLSGGNENHTYRFSASNLNNESVVPNAGFDKDQFTANMTGNYGKLSAQISGNYASERRKNAPRTSDAPGNINYTVYTKPASVSFDSFRGDENKLGAKADGTELRHQGSTYAQNPFWAAYQWQRLDNQTRFFGNVSLKYDVADWLYVQGRIGVDRTDSKYISSEAYGTAFKPLGDYNITNSIIQENNYDLFVGINQEVGDFAVDVLFGGNIYRTSFESARIGGDNLSVFIPFFHSVNNVVSQTYTYGFTKQGTNAIFGQANFSYKDILFLNATGRQESYSTLNPDDNSLFYPSVGASFILSDAIELPSIFSYAKLRGSWAQVGSSGAINPYQLNVTYGLDGITHNGAIIGSIRNNSIPNALLKPLTSNEIEAGFDTRLLQGRLGIDFTYYSRRTTDDILAANISVASGFPSTFLNIGELTNRGVELLITGTPVKTEDFEWSATFNMANNISNVVSLGVNGKGEIIETLSLEEARTRQERIRHEVGQQLGVIAGYTHKTINGQKVYNPDNGQPVRGDFEMIANGRHPFSAGFSNNFRYKNFNLSFLIDVRDGGSLYSGTNSALYRFGIHKETLQGRENGLTITGVDTVGNPLTVDIPANEVQTYYDGYRLITENFVYDASFGKLRELSLGYTFPQKILKKTFVETANLSLVGRNLWLLWSSIPNVDPESGYSSNAGAQGLEYFSAPVTSSFGFNLSVSF